MVKKLSEQEKIERAKRKAERKSKFPPAPPRPLTRKEARYIAKKNMEKSGLVHVNKKHKGTVREHPTKMSYFANHWLEWIHPRKVNNKRKSRRVK